MTTLTPDISLTVSADSSAPAAWNDMVAAFRAFGGIAENVRMGPSPRGTGLVPSDPAKPVDLRVPESLIFAVEDIALSDGRIGIRESAPTGPEERAFFDNYANTLTWGGGGRRDAGVFLAALDMLPGEVREILIANFGMGDFLEGEQEERAKRWFLRSRMSVWKGRNVIVPLVEIANRDASGLALGADAQGCLQINGKVNDEVLVNHGPLDAFGFFRSTGRAHPQAQAYSLPLQLQFEGRALKIERNIAARVARGKFQVPIVRAGRDEISFSHVMIGNSNFPRLSRAIFTALTNESGMPDANEIFDGILYFNRNRFLNLLAAMEPHEGLMITTLRRMVRYQLETMAHCIGTRDV